MRGPAMEMRVSDLIFCLQQIHDGYIIAENVREKLRLSGLLWERDGNGGDAPSYNLTTKGRELLLLLRG